MIHRVTSAQPAQKSRRNHKPLEHAKHRRWSKGPRDKKYRGRTGTIAHEISIGKTRDKSRKKMQGNAASVGNKGDGTSPRRKQKIIDGSERKQSDRPKHPYFERDEGRGSKRTSGQPPTPGAEEEEEPGSGPTIPGPVPDRSVKKKNPKNTGRERGIKTLPTERRGRKKGGHQDQKKSY